MSEIVAIFCMCVHAHCVLKFDSVGNYKIASTHAVCQKRPERTKMIVSSLLKINKVTHTHIYKHRHARPHTHTRSRFQPRLSLSKSKAKPSKLSCIFSLAISGLQLCLSCTRTYTETGTHRYTHPHGYTHTCIFSYSHTRC